MTAWAPLKNVLHQVSPLQNPESLQILQKLHPRPRVHAAKPRPRQARKTGPAFQAQQPLKKTAATDVKNRMSKNR